MREHVAARMMEKSNRCPTGQPNREPAGWMGLYSLCISITFSIECTALAFALCWKTFSGRGSSWREREKHRRNVISS